MLKDVVDFISVGQAGGNIVNEFEKLDNQCFYINSSLDDLDTLDTDEENKYCIENTKGMAKDVNYAEQIIKSNDNDFKIAEKIYKRNPNAHIYFFVFSLSGGTAHMAPYIMVKFKEYFPNKIVNAIVIKPHQDEDMIMHYNAKKSLENIKKCMDNGIITNVQVLDNNSKEFGDKMELNKEFVKLFDEILTFENINCEGNLDEEEFERLFSTKGTTVIHKLDNGDLANNLTRFEDETIYADFIKNPSTHGLIINKKQNNSVNRSIIKDVFGIPTVTHDTIWEKDYNIIVSTGMDFNEGLISESVRYYNDILNKKKEFESKIYEDNKVENIELDNSILNNIIKNKTITQENKPRPNRRNRKVGIENESMFKL